MGPSRLRSRPSWPPIAIRLSIQNSSAWREVQKIEPRLTGFRLARSSCKTLEPGISYRFLLVDEKVAYISIQQATDKEDRVSLMVKPPGMGEIVYTSACGKYLPIMTPYETKDKDRLFIAIMVKSCK